MKFKDTHIHLNTPVYDQDISEVVERAYNAGVVVYDIAIDIDSSKKSIILAKQFPDKVFASAGIHPELLIPGGELYKPDFDIEENVKSLENLIIENREYIKLTGECGLDYYWLDKNSEIENKDEIKENQKRLLISQIELSKKYSLELSLHSRGCIEECIEIVRRYGGEGVFHSLTTDNEDENLFYKQVNQIRELGFKIGINGIITYKSAEMIRRVFSKYYKEQNGDNDITIESLEVVGFILETDGPYLVPSNYNPQVKRRNEPESIVKIFEYIKRNF